MKFFYRKRTLIFIFSFLLSFSSQAQVSKSAKELEAEYYFLQGMKFFILEDYSKAIGDFQVALSYDEENAGIQYQLAQAYAKIGDYDSAIELTKKSIEQESNNPYYYLQLAHFYENLDEKSKAISTYEDLIDKVENQEQYYEKIAELYIFSEKYSKAIETYKELEKIKGETEGVLQRKLQVYILKDDSKNAILEVEKLVIINPYESNYQVILAELLISEKENEKAIEILERKINANNPKALRFLAELQGKTGNKEGKALSTLRKSIENKSLSAEEKIELIQLYFEEEEENQNPEIFLDFAQQIYEQHPENAKASAFYGDMLLVKGEQKIALEKYQKAVRIEEGFLKAWYQIVKLEDRLGKYNDLAKDTELALEIFPNQSVFWLYQGVAFLYLRKDEDAISSFEEAERLSAKNKKIREDINLLKAEVYINQKKYAMATQLVEEVMLKNPEKLQAQLIYSSLLANQKTNLNEALKITKELIEKEPNNADYLHIHAWTFYQKGEYQQALTFFEKAIEQNSTKGIIWERYGDTLFQLGRLEEALQQWETAKSKVYTSDLIDKKIDNQQLYEQ